MPITSTWIRHGESEENVLFNAMNNGHEPGGAEMLKVATWKRRLTPRGKDQARTTGSWYTEWRKNECARRPLFGYVSPYARSMETAGHMSLGIRWKRDMRLGERSWGELSHLSRDEQVQKYADAFERRHIDALLWRPVGGESMQDTLIRGHDFLATLRRDHQDDDVVCVTHGELMHAIRYLHEEWGPEDLNDAMGSHMEGSGIRNGAAIQYSRLDQNGRVHDAYVRKRIVDPTCPANDACGWIEMRARTFSDDELLEHVGRYETWL